MPAPATPLVRLDAALRAAGIPIHGVRPAERGTTIGAGNVVVDFNGATSAQQTLAAGIVAAHVWDNQTVTPQATVVTSVDLATGAAVEVASGCRRAVAGWWSAFRDPAQADAGLLSPVRPGESKLLWTTEPPAVTTLTLSVTSDGRVLVQRGGAAVLRVSLNLIVS